MVRFAGGVLGALLVLALGVCTGCKGNQEGGTAGANTPGSSSNGDILIGEYGSQTGDNATFGISSKNGVLLAADELNAAGGINGRKVRIISEDDQGKPEVATTVVTKLVDQDKVVAVIGEVASTRSLAAAPVCQRAQIPMISPSSTNPKVTQVGDYIFRVCFTDDFQAAVVGQFAYDQGYKKVAIFRDIKNDYSVAFADIFKQKFTSLGGEIVADLSYQAGDSDFRTQLNTIKSKNPDAVLIPGYYTEVGKIARDARNINLNVPLLGGDGWESSTLIPSAGKALEGCFFANHYFSKDLQDPQIQEFVKAYTAKYNQPPDALAALAYDAAKILFEAIKRAKTVDGPGIREALAETRDFQGVTGTITIDSERNARKDALIFQIVGPEFKVFKAYKPEQVGL